MQSKSSLNYGSTLREKFMAKRLNEMDKLERLSQEKELEVVQDFNIVLDNGGFFSRIQDGVDTLCIIGCKCDSISFNKDSSWVQVYIVYSTIDKISVDHAKFSQLIIQDCTIDKLEFKDSEIDHLVFGNNNFKEVILASGRIDQGIIFSELEVKSDISYVISENDDLFSFTTSQQKFYLDDPVKNEPVANLWDIIEKNIGTISINKSNLKGQFFRLLYYKVDNIYLTGNSDSLHTSLSILLVSEIVLELFHYGRVGFNFKHLKPNLKLLENKRPVIKFNASTFGTSCIIQKCDLSGFDIFISDTTLRGMTVQDVIWPTQKHYYTISSSIKDENKKITRADIFLELKMLGKNMGDRDMELTFKRYELNERILLQVSLPDKIMLYLSKSNSFGTNWFKALVIYLCLTVAIYFIILLLHGWLDSADRLYRFIYILDPTHKVEDLFPGICMESNGYLVAIDFTLRIFSSFFIFQIITAFRKHA